MPSAASFDPIDRLITSGGQLILTRSGTTLSLTPSSGDSLELTNTSTSGSLNITDDGGLQINGTEVISSARAITNITTLTASGNINITTGIGEYQLGGVTIIDSGGSINTDQIKFDNSAPELNCKESDDSTLKIWNTVVGKKLTVNLNDGDLQTGGTTRLSNAGNLSNIGTISTTGAIDSTTGFTISSTSIINSTPAIENIAGLSFTDANQTIGLSSASDRTLTFANSGDGNLKAILNSSLICRTVAFDETEVTHTTTTNTEYKSFRYLVSSSINMTPTYMVIMAEMKSGASGESVTANFYIDGVSKWQVNTTSDTYEVKSTVVTLSAADKTDGIHELEMWLDDNGYTSISQRTLEAYLI